QLLEASSEPVWLASTGARLLAEDDVAELLVVLSGVGQVGDVTQRLVLSRALDRDLPEADELPDETAPVLHVGDLGVAHAVDLGREHPIALEDALVGRHEEVARPPQPAVPEPEHSGEGDDDDESTRGA